MPKVFICYSSIDYEFAYILFCALKAAGIDVWLDRAFIKPGQRWRFEIQQVLDTCTHLVLIHTENSKQSKEVWTEWDYCLDAEKIIIPIIAQSGIKLPYPLAMHQHIKFVSDTFPEEYLDSSSELFKSAFDALLYTLIGDWQPQPPDGSGARAPIPVPDWVVHNNRLKAATESKDNSSSRSQHPKVLLKEYHVRQGAQDRVHKLLKHLEQLAEPKVKVFLDRDNLRQDDFFKSLTEKLKESDGVVLLLPKPTDIALEHENERSQITNKILNADYRELGNQLKPALNIIGSPGVGKTLLAQRLLNDIYGGVGKQSTLAVFCSKIYQNLVKFSFGYDETLLTEKLFNVFYRDMDEQQRQPALDRMNNHDQWWRTSSILWIEEIDKRNILMSRNKGKNINSLASGQTAPVVTFEPTTEAPALQFTLNTSMSHLWQDIEAVVEGAFKRVEHQCPQREQDKLCLNDTGHNRNESPEYSRDDIMDYSFDLS